MCDSNQFCRENSRLSGIHEPHCRTSAGTQTVFGERLAKMGVIGLECGDLKTISDNGFRPSPLSSNAEYDARNDISDPKLRDVLAAWAGLDDGIKAAVVAIVRANGLAVR